MSSEAALFSTSRIGSFVGKILIIEREWVAGRICVVLVQEPVGM